MVPWVYEFHWTAFHLIFLNVFFFIALIVVTTLWIAAKRTRSAQTAGRTDAIQWHSDFHDLPDGMKRCRHELSGELQHRTCGNGFECDTCTVHHEFMKQEENAIAAAKYESAMFGFSMPKDRFYHRGHAWVMKDNEGNCLVGLDDFGKRLAGNIDSIELPPVGKQMTVNSTGWTMKTLGTSLRILSLVEGEVLAHGTACDDWLLKIKPKDLNTSTTHLLRGAEIRPWIMREMERLQISFAAYGVGRTLADGGELLKDFHKQYPNANWDGILGQMFLEA